jgi:hypothetical protein
MVYIWHGIKQVNMLTKRQVVMENMIVTMTIKNENQISFFMNFSLCLFLYNNNKEECIFDRESFHI